MSETHIHGQTIMVSLSGRSLTCSPNNLADTFQRVRTKFLNGTETVDPILRSSLDHFGQRARGKSQWQFERDESRIGHGGICAVYQ